MLNIVPESILKYFVGAKTQTSSSALFLPSRRVPNKLRKLMEHQPHLSRPHAALFWLADAILVCRMYGLEQEESSLQSALQHLSLFIEHQHQEDMAMAHAAFERFCELVACL